MLSPRIKTGAFILEGLNSVTVTFYFYFIFWFLKTEYGFGSRENLLWAVGNGLVYVIGSLQGGRYGQRRGYLRAMRIGFAGMAACFLAGWLVNLAGWPRNIEVPVQVVIMVLATFAVCFTWPNLEALVAEGEPPRRLQRFIGIYNLVWSGVGAVTYFAGGALITTFGARNIIFLAPTLVLAVQYVIVRSLSREAGDALPTNCEGRAGSPSPAALSAPPDGEPSKAGAQRSARPTACPGSGSQCVSDSSKTSLPTNAGHPHPGVGQPESEHGHRHAPLPARTFLLMSWIANPCAYVAINTAIPLIPTLAERLGLDTRTAGFFCSIWLFTRTATFIALWQWNGWHYRFRWLAGSYIAAIVGFLSIFLSAAFPSFDRTTALLLSSIAQVVFGIGIGLIYYSSLFYSMDVGDTKGDHGGIHEAAIGAGILGGPLVGAIAVYAVPGSAMAPAWAVSAVLLVGLGVLIRMRYRPKRC